MCKNYSKSKVERFLRHCVYIHFWMLLPCNGILPGAKFTLCPSLAFSYIGNLTAQLSSSGRQPNCGVQQRAPPIFGRAAITLGIGPYFVQLLQCLQDTPLFLQKIRTAMHCCVRTIATSELWQSAQQISSKWIGKWRWLATVFYYVATLLWQVLCFSWSVHVPFWSVIRLSSIWHVNSPTADC